MIDLDPERLAEETYRFYRAYDLDFIKNMPNGLFSVEDFGCECDYSDIPKGGVAKITKYGVEQPDDWSRLEEPDVREGALGREIRSLEILLDKVKGEAPVIVTVFSPLTTAYKLSGPRLIEHLRNRPDKLKSGLQLIAHTTGEFAKEALRKGCAGVFFANQMANRDVLTEAEYAEFSRPYDLQVLGTIRNDSWFNVMHIHGTNTWYPLLLDYPVQAFNWHIWEAEPRADAFRQSAPDKLIVGGLNRFHITNGNLEELKSELRQMIGLTGGERLILSPGCVIRYPVDPQVLQSLIKEITCVRI